MNTKTIYTALLPAALLMLGACSGNDQKKEDNTEKKPTVKVETVSERTVDQLGTYTATVEAEAVNNISSSMPLRIKAIYADEGVRVSKGQRLVQLDDVNTTSYQLQVDNARANLNNVQIEYNRALELFKIGGGTKQQVDQIQTQLINAKNALASAQRSLRNAAENTVLTAPISGVVTKRNYDPGDMTSSLPILSIARVQPVKIVINVSESELPKVHKGMPAKILFDTFGPEEFKGTVTMTMPTVDPQTRTFGVEITVPNPDSRILPGMFGRVTLNLGQTNHVVVPDRAVVKQQGSGNHYVYVYKNGKVEYRLVELGQRLGDAYELLSGVEDGDQVVISSQNNLANGREVTLAK